MISKDKGKEDFSEDLKLSYICQVVHVLLFQLLLLTVLVISFCAMMEVNAFQILKSVMEY